MNKKENAIWNTIADELTHYYWGDCGYGKLMQEIENKKPNDFHYLLDDMCNQLNEIPNIEDSNEYDQETEKIIDNFTNMFLDLYLG